MANKKNPYNEEIKSYEKEKDVKILRYAESKKGKYKLFLQEGKPIYTKEGKKLENYDVKQSDNYLSNTRSSRGSFNYDESNKDFDDEVKGWNEYNTKLGKLEEKKLK